MPPTRARLRADEAAMERATERLRSLPLGPVRILRDGEPASPLLPSLDEGMAWLLRHQPMSTAWALAFEGYSVESAGAQPWSPPERRQAEQTALRILGAEGSVGHGHQRHFEAEECEEEEMTRDSCASCVLRGWNERPAEEEQGQGIERQPNYAGWARIYIQARRPIPSRWRAALIAELSDDNEGYVAALSRDLATWGARWTDDLPEFCRP